MSVAGTTPPPPDDTLVPARILNEHVYCPRLAWLEWEARAFTDNLETVEGRDLHRRVDEERGSAPEPRSGGVDDRVYDDDRDRAADAPVRGNHDGDELLESLDGPEQDPTAPADDHPRTVTALAISSPRLGLTAKLDRVDFRDGVAVPVETKRGKPRRGGPVVWDPERAQLTAQALLLREQGHVVPHAEVFFAETRTRHQVPIPTTRRRGSRSSWPRSGSTRRRPRRPHRWSTARSARAARW